MIEMILEMTPETSRGKAMASVAFRRPTKEMVDLAREHPACWGALPGLAPRQILPSTGGMPFKSGSRVIGAISCGGGTGEEDHQCRAGRRGRAGGGLTGSLRTRAPSPTPPPARTGGARRRRGP